MKPEEQFYLDRSDIISKLTDHIKLCEKLERDIAEELEEVFFEAAKNSEKKLEISIIMEEE